MEDEELIKYDIDHCKDQILKLQTQQAALKQRELKQEDNIRQLQDKLKRAGTQDQRRHQHETENIKEARTDLQGV